MENDVEFLPGWDVMTEEERAKWIEYAQTENFYDRDIRDKEHAELMVYARTVNFLHALHAMVRINNGSDCEPYETISYKE